MTEHIAALFHSTKEFIIGIGNDWRASLSCWKQKCQLKWHWKQNNFLSKPFNPWRRSNGNDYFSVFESVTTTQNSSVTIFKLGNLRSGAQRLQTEACSVPVSSTSSYQSSDMDNIASSGKYNGEQQPQVKTSCVVAAYEATATRVAICRPCIYMYRTCLFSWILLMYDIFLSLGIPSCTCVCCSIWV